MGESIFGPMEDFPAVKEESKLAIFFLQLQLGGRSRSDLQCNKESQSRGYSVKGTSWLIGLVWAQLIGTAVSCHVLCCT